MIEPFSLIVCTSLARAAGGKTSSGLVEFASVTDGLEAVALTNHYKWTMGENRVYTVKLCFSPHQTSLAQGPPAFDQFAEQP